MTGRVGSLEMCRAPDMKKAPGLKNTLSYRYHIGYLPEIFFIYLFTEEWGKTFYGNLYYEMLNHNTR